MPAGLFCARGVAASLAAHCPVRPTVSPSRSAEVTGTATTLRDSPCSLFPPSLLKGEQGCPWFSLMCKYLYVQTSDLGACAQTVDFCLFPVTKPQQPKPHEMFHAVSMSCSALSELFIPTSKRIYTLLLLAAGK